MYSKITAILLLFCSLAGARTILIDRVVAVVNDEIITLTDIQKATLLYPLFRDRKESEKDFQKRVLISLINHKVIYHEYRDEFLLNEEDYEDVQTPVIKKVGSLGELMVLLRHYDMDWQDFKRFIVEKVLYEKVLKDQYSTKITIPYTEIQAFYEGEYLPVQKRLGLQARSLVEMTPLIEKYLRKTYTDDRLKTWLEDIKATYRIENLLFQDSEAVKQEKIP
jgi:peptidyl-prolyl cis-trans isomerase SurA